MSDTSLSLLGLADGEPETSFEAIVGFASRLLKAQVSLVSFVEPSHGRQYFKGATGLPEPWASLRQTPLSHSFCQHVRATDRPLVVADARSHPLVAGNAAIDDLGVVAYLGVPIRDAERRAVGSLCVIEAEPREWTDAELSVLRGLGDLVTDQVRLRAALADSERVRKELHIAHETRLGMLATLSHEIRTAINGIVGVAGILEDDIRDEGKRAHAALIRHTADDLLTVLNDALDISKIEAGKLELTSEPFAPAELAGRVAAVHRPRAAERGVALEVASTQEVEAERLGDPHRVAQILHNLLSNAVKFTERGRVSVGLEGEPDALVLRVEDTGPGMSAEAVGRIFDDYAQADAGVSRRHGGTGLGLGLVRRLAGAMGGGVEIDSAPGEGTTVTARLALPRVAGAPRPVPPPRSTTRAEEDAPLDGWRVLAVDDNATNRLVMERMLRRLGAEPAMAASGEEALAAAGQARFDLVLLDIQMPGMDGIETLDRLAAVSKAHGRTRPPAVAVTANAFAHQVEAYLSQGFEAHLPKPARARALVEVAHAAVSVRAESGAA